MDVVGRFHLADGTEVKVVTGIDDHWRFASAPGSWPGRRPSRCATHCMGASDPRSARADID